MLDHITSDPSLSVRKAPKRIGFLHRLGGAEDEIAPHCSAHDLDALLWRGMILLSGFVPSVLVWSIGLTQLTGRILLGTAVAVLLALSVAAAVLAYDRAHLGAGWLRSGRRILESRGALVPLETGAGPMIGRLIAGVPRLLLPLCGASVGTALALTVAFAGDIANWQREENFRRNATVYAEAERSHQAMVAAAEVAQADARSIAQQLAQERSRLSLGGAEGTVVMLEREIAAAANRRDALLPLLSQAQAEIVQREADVAAEQNGMRLRNDHSGRPGNGPLAQYHAQRAIQARAEAARLIAEVALAERQAATLRDQARQERQGGQASRQARLTTTEHQLTQAMQREDVAATELRRLITDRAAIVVAIAHARPDYIPPPDGVGGRLEGLHGFAMRSWSNAALVLSAELFLVLLELMGMLAALRMPPTGYGIRLAVQLEDELRRGCSNAFEHDIAVTMRNALRTPAV